MNENISMIKNEEKNGKNNEKHKYKTFYILIISFLLILLKYVSFYLI